MSKSKTQGCYTSINNSIISTVNLDELLVNSRGIIGHPLPNNLPFTKYKSIIDNYCNEQLAAIDSIDHSEINNSNPTTSNNNNDKNNKIKV
mgnify:CR=1 FL=1